MKIVTTLSIIEDKDRVLLGMKKRGFGAGWWNGFGGKVHEGESIEEAMKRELEEESGIIAKVYKERAVIEFVFDKTDKIVEMHVYEITEYEGEPKESEEMSPRWFLKTEVPFGQMWPADKEWMTMFFEGMDIEGQVVFDGETHALISTDFREKRVNIEPEITTEGGKIS